MAQGIVDAYNDTIACFALLDCADDQCRWLYFDQCRLRGELALVLFGYQGMYRCIKSLGCA